MFTRRRTRVDSTPDLRRHDDHLDDGDHVGQRHPDRGAHHPDRTEVRSDHPTHHRRGVAHPRRRPAERHVCAGMGERREPRLHADRSGAQGVRHARRRARPRHRRRQRRQRLRVARHRHRHDRGDRFRRRPGDDHRRVPGLHRRVERVPGRRRVRRVVRLVRRGRLGAPRRAGGGVHLRSVDRPVREQRPPHRLPLERPTAARRSSTVRLRTRARSGGRPPQSSFASGFPRPAPRKSRRKRGFGSA